jgi:hypothetical protein
MYRENAMFWKTQVCSGSLYERYFQKRYTSFEGARQVRNSKVENFVALHSYQKSSCNSKSF